MVSETHSSCVPPHLTTNDCGRSEPAKILRTVRHVDRPKAFQLMSPALWSTATKRGPARHGPVGPTRRAGSHGNERMRCRISLHHGRARIDIHRAKAHP